MQYIHGLSMDHLPSNVVATPVICYVSMDHLPSNVVATPVICYVSMDSQVESNIQVCYGSNLSNSSLVPRPNFSRAPCGLVEK